MVKAHEVKAHGRDVDAQQTIVRSRYVFLFDLERLRFPPSGNQLVPSLAPGCPAPIGA